jgi:hypothetical protein
MTCNAGILPAVSESVSLSNERGTRSKQQPWTAALLQNRAFDNSEKRPIGQEFARR